MMKDTKFETMIGIIAIVFAALAIVLTFFTNTAVGGWAIAACLSISLVCIDYAVYKSLPAKFSKLQRVIIISLVSLPLLFFIVVAVQWATMMI
jgi:hypothetical protein